MMSRMNTTIIILSAAAAAVSSTVAAVVSQERKSHLRFLALGDWGGEGVEPYCTKQQREVSNGMAFVAAARRQTDDGSSTIPAAEFILALGDNFYSTGLPMNDWDHADLRFKKTFEEVYSQKELKKPWYVVAGNHDYCGDVTKQIEYAQKESTLWVYPDYNYDIIREFKTKDGNKVKVEILMIDTQWIAGFFECKTDQQYPEGIQPHLQAKALSFVEGKLKKSSAEYLLVAGHYPVFSACSNGNTKVLIEKLDPLLKKYGVTAYISGHDHCQFHYNYENMEYLLSGIGKDCCYGSEEKKNLPESGKLRYLLADDSDYSGSSGVKGGFLSFDVGEEDMVVRMHIETGETFYETTLLPRKKINLKEKETALIGVATA